MQHTIAYTDAEQHFHMQYNVAVRPVFCRHTRAKNTITANLEYEFKKRSVATMIGLNRLQNLNRSSPSQHSSQTVTIHKAA